MQRRIVLNINEEYRLKKQLVEFILEDEFARLEHKSDVFVNGMDEFPFTGYCFNKFVKGIPLIKKEESLWIQVDTLIASIKELRLSTSEERGKKDLKSKRTIEKFKVMCTLFFTRTLQTPISRENRAVEEAWLQQEKLEFEKLMGVEEINLKIENYKAIQEDNRIILEWSNKMNGEPDGKSIKNLFEWVKAKEDIKDIPQCYQQLFQSVASVAAFRMYIALHVDPRKEEHLAHLKLIYNLVPFNILRGLVKLTNPAKLFKHTISILLSRPFGAKSVIQRVIEKAAIDEEEEEEDLEPMDEANLSKKDLYKIINNKRLVDKIINFVHRDPNHIPQLPSGIHPIDRVREVLHDQAIEPQLSPSDLQIITDKQINALYQLLVREIRARDLLQISSFFGQDHIIQIVENLLEAIYSPLFKVSQKANLEDFFKYICTFLSETKKIAQSKKYTESQALIEYKRVISLLIEQIFQSIHKLLTVDDGTVESLFCWFMENYYPSKTFNIDLDGLVSLCLTPNQQDSLMAELQELIKWKHKKRGEKMILLPGMKALVDLEIEKENSILELNTMRLLMRPFLAHTVAVLESQDSPLTSQ